MGLYSIYILYIKRTLREWIKGIAHYTLSHKGGSILTMLAGIKNSPRPYIIIGVYLCTLVKVPAGVLHGNYWARGKFEKVM